MMAPTHEPVPPRTNIIALPFPRSPACAVAFLYRTFRAKRACMCLSALHESSSCVRSSCAIRSYAPPRASCSWQTPCVGWTALASTAARLGNLRSRRGARCPISFCITNKFPRSTPQGTGKKFFCCMLSARAWCLRNQNGFPFEAAAGLFVNIFRLCIEQRIWANSRNSRSTSC